MAQLVIFFNLEIDRSIKYTDLRSSAKLILFGQFDYQQTSKVKIDS